MTDLAPPAIAAIGALLLGAATVAAFASAADLVPAHRAATAVFADRVDASDTTLPLVEIGDLQPPPPRVETPPPSPVVTPPRTWTRGLPCRGCGPSRHVVVDEAYDHKWYGDLWQDYR